MAGSDDTSPFNPGDHFGDYAVERLLGKGSIGTVYLMRSADGEPFAVKIMHRGKMSHDLRVRFAREAEAAMRIQHKGLVSVYDVGEDPDTGLCYIIMDYVPGGTLADRIRERGKIPVGEAVNITMQIAAALEAVHGNGLVHRDVKPDNIMFAEDGTPKLSDLGVAKFGDDSNTMVTMTGMVIGTPAYMSPEQLMDSHKIDARADIYSLGVILYEMLSGKRPNRGSTSVELLAKAIKGVPLPDIRKMQPEVPAAIAHVLSLMCSPNPGNRPATAADAVNLLHRASTGKLLVIPKKSPKSSVAADAEKAAKRKRKLAFWTVAIGLLACLAIGEFAGIMYAVFRYRTEDSPKPKPAMVPVTANMSTDDFDARITGVAVIDGSSLQGDLEKASFLSPDTPLSVPFGFAAVFRVEYDFPGDYETSISVSGRWPSDKRSNYAYLGRSRSASYKGKGTAYSFLTMRESGRACTLESVKVSIRSNPELDEYPNGWIAGTTAVHLDFKEKSGSDGK